MQGGIGGDGQEAHVPSDYGVDNDDDDDDYRCKEALEAMGKKHMFLGKTGAGARMKLVVNMIMGSSKCRV